MFNDLFSYFNFFIYLHVFSSVFYYMFLSIFSCLFISDVFCILNDLIEKCNNAILCHERYNFFNGNQGHVSQKPKTPHGFPVLYRPVCVCVRVCLSVCLCKCNSTHHVTHGTVLSPEPSRNHHPDEHLIHFSC